MRPNSHRLNRRPFSPGRRPTGRLWKALCVSDTNYSLETPHQSISSASFNFLVAQIWWALFLCWHCEVWFIQRQPHSSWAICRWYTNSSYLSAVFQKWYHWTVKDKFKLAQHYSFINVNSFIIESNLRQVKVQFSRAIQGNCQRIQSLLLGQNCADKFVMLT